MDIVKLRTMFSTIGVVNHTLAGAITLRFLFYFFAIVDFYKFINEESYFAFMGKFSKDWFLVEKKTRKVNL